MVTTSQSEALTLAVGFLAPPTWASHGLPGTEHFNKPLPSARVYLTFSAFKPKLEETGPAQ